MPILWLPIGVGLIASLPWLSVVVSVSAIVKTNITVVHPYKIAVVVVTCCISQARCIKAVGNSTVTIAYVKIRVGIAVSTGIYHPAWMHVITTPYHWAVNVECVVVKIRSARAVNIIDIIHLYTVAGNPFNIVNPWPGNVPAVIIGVKIINHVTAAIDVDDRSTGQIIIVD